MSFSIDPRAIYTGSQPRLLNLRKKEKRYGTQLAKHVKTLKSHHYSHSTHSQVELLTAA